MSYGFDLMRIPPGPNPTEAWLRLRDQQQPRPADPGPLDAAKESLKQRLVAALTARNPELKVFERNYARIAQNRSISEEEARRLFRDVQLNDHAHSIQIELFDDAAGVAFSFSGDTGDCEQAFQALWSSLEILESAGGFSVYDEQLARVVNLAQDHDSIRQRLCGS